MTEDQILDEHPDLEKDDFTAVYQFAAETGRNAEECDFPLGTIEELLRLNAVRISEFEKDPDAALLGLRFPSDKGVR
jgi:hypothetical protein